MLGFLQDLLEVWRPGPCRRHAVPTGSGEQWGGRSVYTGEWSPGPLACSWCLCCLRGHGEGASAVWLWPSAPAGGSTVGLAGGLMGPWCCCPSSRPREPQLPWAVLRAPMRLVQPRGNSAVWITGTVSSSAGRSRAPWCAPVPAGTSSGTTASPASPQVGGTWARVRRPACIPGGPQGWIIDPLFLGTV